MANHRKPVTFETVRRIAHGFANVEDGTSYGTPALKVKGKLLVRLRDDIDSIVVKMPFAKRDALIDSDPETYYITDHYVRYEWLLVRLSTVRPEALPEILQTAYDAATTARRSPKQR